MDFRVLGPFEVHDGEGALPIGPFRQRAVLAMLTIHAGQALSTDRIIEEVWAGSPPRSALNTLHAYISRLRGVLHTGSPTGEGGDVLVSRDPGYMLAVDGLQIDACRFEAEITDASAAFAAGEPEAAANGIRQAMGLWRGTALADFAYEPFAATESQRLMERRIEAIELRIDADLALARHSSLVAELEGLVADHPLRERLWCQLMTAFYRCGRQAEALAAYGRVRSQLIDELGIEPGPELRRLEQQVLEQSTELAWHPVQRDVVGDAVTVHPRRDEQRTSVNDDGIDRTATQGGAELLPLVGREDQLNRLSRVLHTASAEGSPPLIMIMGEAGCGKTRLLTEFGRQVRAEGALVVGGSAERGSSLAYGALAEMVRDLVSQTDSGLLERVGHLRGDLAWLLPELGPLPSGDSGDLELARTRLFEAIFQLLDGAGSGEPLLLVLDDAQWAGDAVLSLVRMLLDRPWSRSVVVVLSVRTERGDRRVNIPDPLLDLLRREGTTTIDVGRLSAADLISLLDQHPSGYIPDDPEVVAQRLREQTAGIPLLVREVLALGASTELPVPHPDTQPHRVSTLIEGVIGRRLSEVAEPAIHLLEAAAVVGMRFDLNVLSRLTGDSPVGLLEILEEPLASGLLVETSDIDAFAFDHGLIRDVLIDSMSAHRQIRMHGQLAQIFADLGSSVEAARHGLLSYVGISAEGAVALALDGADAAMAALDFETAFTLCSNALAGPATELAPGTRADLLLRLGRAESLMGRLEDAEASWKAAASLAREAGDFDRLAQIAIGCESLARAHVRVSDLRWTLLSEALEKTGPEWTPVRLLVASDWLLEAGLPHRRALSFDFVTEVVDAAIKSGDRDALIAAYHARYALARGRQRPECREWSVEFLEVAEELGSYRWLFQAYLACLIECVTNFEGPGMNAGLDQLRLTCANHREPRSVWQFELAAATCACLRGEFEIADEHAERAGQIGQRHGIPDVNAARAAGYFVNAYHRGGLEKVSGVLGEFARLVPDVAAWTFAAGLAAVDADDVGEGRSLLTRGLEILPNEPENPWLPSLCLGIELAGLIGAETADIERLIGLLSPYSGLFAVVGSLSSEFGPTDRCLGILAAGQGRVDDAEAYFSSAVEACQRLGARPWELRTRADWFIAEKEAGRPARPWWDTLQSELEASGLEGTLNRLERAAR